MTSVVLDRPQKLFDQFSTRASRVSAGLVLWFASLGLILLLGLTPKWVEVGQLRDTRSSLEALGAGSDRFNDALEQYRIDKDTARTVKFRLPGLEFDVASVVAPVTWNLLCLFALIYLSHSRKVLLNLAARGLRVHRDANPDGGHRINWVAIPPWWLAPFPTEDGSQVTVDDLKRALCWGKGQAWAPKFLRVMLGVVLVSQLFVAWISVSLNMTLAKGALTVVAPSLSVLAVSLSVFTLWRWKQLREIPDHSFDDEPSHKITRRQFHVTLLTSTFAALLVPSAFWLRKFTQRNPRYAPRKKSLPRSTNLDAGFYLNDRSAVLHYVSKQHQAWLPNAARESDFSPVLSGALPRPSRASQGRAHTPARVPGSHQPPPRLRLSRATRDLERAALDSLDLRDYATAIRLLQLAAEYDIHFTATSTGRPSYRVFDLLAILAVRYRDRGAFKNLIELAKRRGGMGDRIEKWTSKEAWRGRCLDTSTEYKWADVVV